MWNTALCPKVSVLGFLSLTSGFLSPYFRLYLHNYTQKAAIEYWIFINWFLWKAILFVVIHSGQLWLWGALVLSLIGASCQAVPWEWTLLALKNGRYFKFILARAVNFCLKNKQISRNVGTNLFCITIKHTP